MLKHLSIKNYILINELEMDLNTGFTVITGETGAGKSILVGALSMILGKRADTAVLLDKDKKCIIEGVFSVKTYGLEGFFENNDLDHEEQVVLRREINNQGKSRAFINDTPVKLPVLKLLGEKLVDIHSQHENLLLNKSGFQMAVLDNYAGNAGILNNYRSAYKTYIGIKEELKSLLEREKEIRGEEDYLRFQFDELEVLNLREDELESLEEELKVLSHAEEIKGSLYEITQSMNLSQDNLNDRLQDIISRIGEIAAYHQDIAAFKERIDSMGIEMKDISYGLEKLEEQISYDPARLEEVISRMDSINGLLQKHHVTNSAELLQILNEIGEKLQGISSLDEEIEKLRKSEQKSLKELSERSNMLRKSRIDVCPDIEEQIITALDKLGMKDAKLKVEFQELEQFTAWGTDHINFLFSANLGSPAAPIAKIASGGELSRLMLAIKSMITMKSLLPTIILDEIDMGVSGDIAGKVGTLLGEMAGNMQLIAITHLPQIAGKAGEHFKVFKKYNNDRTVSGVKRLSDSERVDEIALMLSDEKLSKAAKDTAKELLSN